MNAYLRRSSANPLVLLSALLAAFGAACTSEDADPSQDPGNDAAGEGGSASGGSASGGSGGESGGAGASGSGSGGVGGAGDAGEGGTGNTGNTGGGGTGGTGGSDGDPTGLQVYGAWHCGDDACTWKTVRKMDEFDEKNHWLIDRGDGEPSVNLVILSFVNPKSLLEGLTDAGTVDGVPIGMTPEVIDYFKSRGIRVMLSIGGITFVKDWEDALTADSRQLGLNAALVARELGVGIEIDFEANSDEHLTELQSFIDAYRSEIPYDATGGDHAARLTIDLAAGTLWLPALSAKATADWLDPARPVLDYANAMVAGRSQPSASATADQWREHIDGNARMTPPIPPLAPAKLAGSIWLHGGDAECTAYDGSTVAGTRDFVETVAPKVGKSTGLLGYMFWAAECEGTKTECTVPPNTCEGGVGAGAKALGIPSPMPALRQE